MSFYGQVIYEFTKLFNIVSFKNAGLTVSNDFGSGANTDLHRFKADERWDTMSIETGNRWIRFLPDADAQHCKVYHAEPGSKKTTTKGFAQIEDKATLEKTILSPGAILQVDENDYDAAGHFIQSKKKNYKLPSSIINLNDSTTDVHSDTDTNKLHFLGDTWINLSGERSEGSTNPSGQNDRLRFRHKTYRANDGSVDSFDVIASGGTQLSEGASFQVSNISYDKAGHISGTDTASYKLPYHAAYNGDKTIEGFKKVTAQSGATQLNSGDCISTDVVTVDNKGHVTGVTTQYYTLPYTDFEQDLDQIQSDITSLQNNKADNSALNSVKTLAESNKGRIDAFPNDYVLKTTFDPVATRVTNLENNLSTALNTTLPNTYATRKTVGEISALHSSLTDDTVNVMKAIGPWSNLYADLGTGADQVNPASVSLTKTIGSVDKYSNRVNLIENKTDGTLYSIADALDIIGEAAQDADSSTKAVNARLSVALQKLHSLYPAQGFDKI
jgi:hypothetical protein